MNKAEKAERRLVKHKLQADVKQALSREYRLGHTPWQVKAAAKVMVERLIAQEVRNGR